MTLADAEQISTVLLAVLKARVRACVSKAVAWAKRSIREALRPAPVAGGLLCDLFRSGGELPAPNLADPSVDNSSHLGCPCRRPL